MAHACFVAGRFSTGNAVDDRVSAGASVSCVSARGASGGRSGGASDRLPADRRAAGLSDSGGFHCSWFATGFQLAADGHRGWGPGLWIRLVVLAWAATIAAVVWLIRQTGGRREPDADSSLHPAEILDRRFAEGAISAEECRERRETLR